MSVVVRLKHRVHLYNTDEIGNIVKPDNDAMPSR